jgi:hypothetical protein
MQPIAILLILIFARITERTLILAKSCRFCNLSVPHFRATELVTFYVCVVVAIGMVVFTTDLLWAFQCLVMFNQQELKTCGQAIYGQ